ncbi:hypothetical protein CBM2595_A80051 [Cupriavidus taiwanensis]|nr:hypothetical protein CBM2595_A80051 [Cupriavidus taiwanensis]
MAIAGSHFRRGPLDKSVLVSVKISPQRWRRQLLHRRQWLWGLNQMGEENMKNNADAAGSIKAPLGKPPPRGNRQLPTQLIRKACRIAPSSNAFPRRH